MALQNVPELKADVQELQHLLELAVRPKVKDMLSLEVRKIQTQISKLETQAGESAVSSTAETKPNPLLPRCYDIKLTNYAWDQSDKFMKIFVTLKNVHTIPAENVTCNFTNRIMELNVKLLENRNYTLTIRNLLEDIVPNKSHWKVKTDMVIVFLSKSKEESKWQYVTKDEQKAKEVKTPKMDPGEDPEKGLMKLMQQMYEDGDDEMKRTMAKAWTENREKSGASPPGFGF